MGVQSDLYFEVAPSFPSKVYEIVPFLSKMVYETERVTKGLDHGTEPHRIQFFFSCPPPPPPGSDLVISLSCNFQCIFLCSYQWETSVGTKGYSRSS